MLYCKTIYQKKKSAVSEVLTRAEYGVDEFFAELTDEAYDVENYTAKKHDTTTTIRNKNVKSFPSRKAHRAALISVSLALRQTPVTQC